MMPKLKLFAVGLSAILVVAAGMTSFVVRSADAKQSEVWRPNPTAGTIADLGTRTHIEGNYVFVELE
jgi:hypothetical protein